MNKLLVFLINTYQKTPFKSHGACVFLPTCSEYTKQAIFKHGSLRGVFMGLRRVLRCHPWQKNHYDPVK